MMVLVHVIVYLLGEAPPPTIAVKWSIEHWLAVHCPLKSCLIQVAWLHADSIFRLNLSLNLVLNVSQNLWNLSPWTSYSLFPARLWCTVVYPLRIIMTLVGRSTSGRACMHDHNGLFVTNSIWIMLHYWTKCDTLGSFGQVTLCACYRFVWDCMSLIRVHCESLAYSRFNLNVDGIK